MVAATLALALIFGACDLQGEKDSVEYTVTFDSDGGKPETQTRTVGKDASLGSLPANPSRTGYTFGGWYTSRNGGGASFTGSTKVSANITVYAKWTPVSSVQYTITYNVNGGTGTAPPVQTANSGTEITLADGTGLTQAGYTFSGWNTNASGNGTPYAGGASFLVTSDITLYAAWTAASDVRYTVTYDVNGGTGTAPPVQTVNNGVLIALADGTGLTKDGHTFSGWNTNASGTGTSYDAGASFPVTSDITLYAKWTAAQYTVTYDVNGGTGTAPPAWTANSGTEITLADGTGLSNAGYTFSGWNTGVDGTGTAYAGGASFTVTSDITLYAMWNMSIATKLDQLASNAEDGGEYTFTLSADESMGPKTLSYSGKHVSIRIIGGDTERTISLSGDGSLFTVGIGVTLTLGNNITLQRQSNNNASLVQVGSGGTLVMETGSKITGNHSSSGSGVYVAGNATFTMSGGAISGNTTSTYYSSYGGGVYVASSATFTMSGGAISGNSSSYGGGVYVADNATFTMSGGAISGNIAFSNSSSYGGGVYVADNATFTMSGGAISGNTAYSSGGGVFVAGNGTFTKQSEGIIYGWDAESDLKNTASNYYGHAVYVASSPNKLRNSTVGEGVTLDSAQTGDAGGWGAEPMPTTSLQNALAWLVSNAEEGGEYTITINADESRAPTMFSYSGKNVSIRIVGGDTEHTISLSSSGSLFTVGSGVTLTLGNNLTLQGLSDNMASLVMVNSGGTLTMETGSKITGNRNYSSSTYGGGVNVASNGTFTMSGGAISGNSTSSSSSSGGGVFVSGTFTMSDGTISGNTAYSSSGGGVSVSSSGTFTKQSGGAIYGSDAESGLKNTAGNDNGHAVYVSSGSKRNTTAGEGVTLDSAQDGNAGGWE
jgi:uncharacterized repeat protein (TIGR02543 family)